MGREDEVGEQHTECENPCGAIARQLLLIGEIGPLEGEAGRKVLASELLHQRDCLAGTDARGGVAIDVSRRKRVVADHSVGSGRVVGRDHRGQRHELTRSIARLQQPQCGLVGTELRVGLDVDAIAAIEERHIIDVVGSEVRLERLIHVAERELM